MRALGLKRVAYSGPPSACRGDDLIARRRYLVGLLNNHPQPGRLDSGAQPLSSVVVRKPLQEQLSHERVQRAMLESSALLEPLVQLILDSSKQLPHAPMIALKVQTAITTL